MGSGIAYNYRRVVPSPSSYNLEHKIGSSGHGEETRWRHFQYIVGGYCIHYYSCFCSKQILLVCGIIIIITIIIVVGK